MPVNWGKLGKLPYCFCGFQGLRLFSVHDSGVMATTFITPIFENLPAITSHSCCEYHRIGRRPRIYTCDYKSLDVNSLRQVEEGAARSQDVGARYLTLLPCSSTDQPASYVESYKLTVYISKVIHICQEEWAV